MNKNVAGYIVTATGSSLFALMSLLMKIAYSKGMTVWGYTLIVALIGTVLLSLIQLFRSEPLFPAALRPQWQAALIAIVGGTLVTFGINLSLVSLSISLAMVLFFTYPAMTAAIAWPLLGQRPTGRHVLALALSLAGAALIVSREGDFRGSLVGILLGLMAAAGQAFCLTLGERIGPALPSFTVLWGTRVGVLLGSLLVGLGPVREVVDLPGELLLFCLMATVIGNIAPFFLLFKGMRLIGAAAASLVTVIELPVALLLGWLYAGDRIGPVELVGAALVMGAVLLSRRKAPALPAQGRRGALAPSSTGRPTPPGRKRPW
jgi:DME family drug/metabolite transporter